jgi:hypothetical protein
MMERGDKTVSPLSRAKSAQEVQDALSSNDNPLDKADSELLDLLKEWDTNGDGQYSVEEVLLIARHFQQKQRQVTKLRRTLCLGTIFTLALLVGVLLVAIWANQLTKDMRPNQHGVLTAYNGKVAGAAQVLQRGELEKIRNMRDADLAEIQFVSFDLTGNHYALKVAGVARSQLGAQSENGTHQVVDLFFANGPFTKMELARDISVVRPDGTAVVVDSAEKRRRLAGSAPWAHIGSAGIVGISGTNDVQVAGAPWTHIR